MTPLETEANPNIRVGPLRWGRPVHVDTAQMLEAMGYEGIKAALAAARVEDVSPRIDTGTFLVTPETSAEYKALIGME